MQTGIKWAISFLQVIIAVVVVVGGFIDLVL
jgi:hypothetical protein